MLTGVTSLDMSDILIQQLEILLTGEVTDTAATGTLGHRESESLTSYRLVSLCLGIEIGEFDGRYLVFTLMTGNGKDIINHRTLETVWSQFGLVCDLRIILIEILRESHFRLFDEFEVSGTADDNTKTDGVVGLDIGLVKLGRDAELTDTTREVCRTLGQGVYLHLYARSQYSLC